MKINNINIFTAPAIVNDNNDFLRNLSNAPIDLNIELGCNRNS